MSARKRFTALASIAAVAGLLLTGCAGNAGNADEEAVSKLALAEFPTVELDTMDDPAVVGVWEFGDGYVALVEQTGTANGKDATDRWAYEFTPAGDSWERGNYNEVDSDAGAETSPHRAACLTVADTETEQNSCASIEE